MSSEKSGDPPIFRGLPPAGARTLPGSTCPSGGSGSQTTGSDPESNRAPNADWGKTQNLSLNSDS